MGYSTQYLHIHQRKYILLRKNKLCLVKNSKTKLFSLTINTKSLLSYNLTKKQDDCANIQNVLADYPKLWIVY